MRFFAVKGTIKVLILWNNGRLHQRREVLLVFGGAAMNTLSQLLLNSRLNENR